MRYEIKYEVASYDPEFLRNAIFMHPLSFREAYPDRKVYNIYFDTEDLDFFYQNINGDPDRKKLRLRWYDHNTPREKARLEIKCKHRELGWKDVIEIDEDLSSYSLQEITEMVNDRSGSQQNLTAALFNTYLRSYYESFDGKFRMTLDRNLSFRWPDLLDIETGEMAMDTTILEIKFERGYMDYFEDINRYLPFRQTKFSKYSHGITALQMV